MNLAELRSIRAPFIPQLESDADTGYFDDFDNPDDMKKYKEVQDKARNVEGKVGKNSDKNSNGGRGMWVGFTFGKNGPTKFDEDTCEPANRREASDVFATMF